MNDNWKKLQKQDIDVKKVMNMKELHNKIDSVYTLLETLSNRLNKLDYSGEITYGEPHHIGCKEKQISVTLSRKEEITSPNPHGDDDFAKPE